MFRVIHRHDTFAREDFRAALEQAIRFIVIDRHVTQGTRSAKGRRANERLWTVIATCALQGRSAFEFILQAVQAYFHDSHPPSLLPNPP
jgi:hypothetical protein